METTERDAPDGERAEQAVPVDHDQPTAREAGRRRLWFRAFQLASLALIAGLLALLAWRIVTGSRGSDLVAGVRAGKRPPAPTFRLPVIWPRSETWPSHLRQALASDRLSLAKLRGEPVVLNFWASWCIPCKKEAPLLVASARAHAGKVAFLGVDVQDFTSDARRFLRRYHVNYVSVRDGGGSTSGGYGLTGVPETYFIDRDGRIVAHVPGQLSEKQLEEGTRLTLSPSRPVEGPPQGPYEGSRPPPGIRIPDVTLTSYRGRAVSLRALEGKVVLVTFLDTACREKCPIIAGEIGRAIPLLTPAERADVEAVAITVLPQVDTPARIETFLRQRHALGSLDWLIGPPADLPGVWKAFSILAAAESGNADIHSAAVRVFDPNGVWVSSLHAGVDLTPANLVHDIRVALRAAD